MRPSHATVRGTVPALLVLLALLWFCPAPLAAGATPESAGTRHVLFLSSYSLAYPTVEKQIAGLREGLDESIHLTYEFLDSRELPSGRDAETFYQYLCYKYTQMPLPDLVVAGDDNALQLVMRHRTGLFAGLPVVYEAVDSEARAQLADSMGMTGIAESSTIGPNLDLACSVYPDAARLLAITDDSVTGEARATTVRALKSRYPGLTFSFLNTAELTPAQILAAVSSLDDSTILVYLSFTADVTGKNYTYDEAIHLIVDNAAVPVFSSLWLGEGVLGGVQEDFESIGREAGQMAMRILNGAAVADVTPAKAANSAPVIDAAVARQYGLAQSRFPAGTRYINDDKAGQLTRRIVAAFSVGCGVLLALLLLFARENRRRRREETQLRQASDLLREEAAQDALTGLGNRRAFDAELQRMARARLDCTLFLFDLDGFKQINDTYGHSAGDAVLKGTGKRLRALQTGWLKAYRFGGDEFAVLLSGTRPAEQTRCADALLGMFAIPFSSESGPIQAAASVGSARFPADADTGGALLACADRALYYGKRHGKSRAVRFAELPPEAAAADPPPVCRATGDAAPQK